MTGVQTCALPIYFPYTIRSYVPEPVIKSSEPDNDIKSPLKSHAPLAPATKFNVAYSVMYTPEELWVNISSVTWILPSPSTPWIKYLAVPILFAANVSIVCCDVPDNPVEPVAKNVIPVAPA